MSDKRPILTYEAQINRVLPGLIPEIREQVLADAKARIEEINIEHHVMPHRHDDYALFEVALNCALAALTQPQTEKCPQCGGDGKGPLTHHFGEPCPTCDGGGAAVAAGARGADLELPLTNSTLVEEVIAAVYEACLDRAMGEEDASEVAAVLRGQLTGTRPTPSTYTKAFRERVCPVPEFPGIEKEES